MQFHLITSFQHTEYWFILLYFIIIAISTDLEERTIRYEAVKFVGIWILILQFVLLVAFITLTMEASMVKWIKIYSHSAIDTISISALKLIYYLIIYVSYICKSCRIYFGV